ncbi:hypothetical protein ES319_A13G118700v1 [Gossypium barbadense]|uniref:Uncharacterized protein n=2 Tax=Gossypium TaxID=3633 RepID=A0A5J5T1I4_GOSBA|nr:hypothetical protein ES319_A13G118700v1 [Gossypium barbadense]TYG86324.1 hypothetical protein ES288_A13G125500v1 [Gossypium darwinii]
MAQIYQRRRTPTMTTKVQHRTERAADVARPFVGAAAQGDLGFLETSTCPGHLG